MDFKLVFLYALFAFSIYKLIKEWRKVNLLSRIGVEVEGELISRLEIDDSDGGDSYQIKIKFCTLEGKEITFETTSINKLMYQSSIPILYNPNNPYSASVIEEGVSPYRHLLFWSIFTLILGIVLIFKD